MICQSWKVMFQAEYSSGQPLRMLVDLRAAIDDALGRGTRSSAKPKPAAPPAKKAVAASASAGATKAPTAKFKVDADASPEFEVSGGASDWNPNGDEK
jgi:hypothetical protein